MEFFTVATLQAFYEELRAGIDVETLQVRLQELDTRPRRRGDVNDARLSRGLWKRLVDEVWPVARLLQNLGSEWSRGWVRFPLDNGDPDGWVRRSAQEPVTPVQVTISQGAARFKVMDELVRTGEGRGFLGLQDDEPRSVFDTAMARSRRMYTADQAINAVAGGVRACFAKKNQAKFADFWLIVQAQLRSLPRERWVRLMDDLAVDAAILPFSQVHVVSDSDGHPCAFRLK